MTSAAAPTISVSQLADNALRTVLQTQWDGEPAVRLDSPPGAGKTGVVERLAMQSLAVLRERCMLATQTNEQAFDIARRLARGYTRHSFFLLTRRELALPPDLSSLCNLSIVNSARDLPTGPCVAISNAAKWSWVQDPPMFDLQVVDEAFQLPDYRFQQIAGMASRFVLVGDPGQIDPVVTCEVERWKSDSAGPHVPCPRALTKRHPAVRTLSLPVSRRLVADTVRYIQPAFYPKMAFAALSAPGARGLSMPVSGALAIDRPLNLVQRGASLVLVELDDQITGESTTMSLVPSLQWLSVSLHAGLRSETTEKPNR